VACRPFPRARGSGRNAGPVYWQTQRKIVNKWYGNNFHVLRDIDLSVAKGERIVICGPSGSGKSTLIRCINRLEEHQQGTSSSTASS
jgi:ABC-type polar amino acid transport system ATPase subunit